MFVHFVNIIKINKCDNHFFSIYLFQVQMGKKPVKSQYGALCNMFIVSKKWTKVW